MIRLVFIFSLIAHSSLFQVLEWPHQNHLQNCQAGRTMIIIIWGAEKDHHSASLDTTLQLWPRDTCGHARVSQRHAWWGHVMTSQRLPRHWTMVTRPWSTVMMETVPWEQDQTPHQSSETPDTRVISSHSTTRWSPGYWVTCLTAETWHVWEPRVADWDTWRGSLDSGPASSSRTTSWSTPTTCSGQYWPGWSGHHVPPEVVDTGRAVWHVSVCQAAPGPVTGVWLWSRGTVTICRDWSCRSVAMLPMVDSWTWSPAAPVSIIWTWLVSNLDLEYVHHEAGPSADY